MESHMIFGPPPVLSGQEGLSARCYTSRILLQYTRKPHRNSPIPPIEELGTRLDDFGALNMEEERIKHLLNDSFPNSPPIH